MSEPKFHVGQVVRVKDPSGFFAAFGKKIADRDAVVLENIMDYMFGQVSGRCFQGRVRVEFQKRNGRGQEFKETMQERNFIAKDEA